MEFSNLIKERKSIRLFKKQKIEDEKLNEILKIANSAPSAGNLQSYEIYIIRSENKKEQLSRAALNQSAIIDADVVLVFCANTKRALPKYGARGTDLYCIQDATIACAYAQLATANLGLGSVWIGAFHERQVGEIIGANLSYEKPISILPIGYPAEKPRTTTRRKIADIVHEEK